MGLKISCEMCGKTVIGIFSSLKKVNGRYICSSCSELTKLQDSNGFPVTNINPQQFALLIRSNRLTIMDGIKVGCGIFIVLPILILLIKVIFGISLLSFFR